MAVPVIMPRQGQSVESCIIAAWHKKKGDLVKKGDILFTYETDKATFDEETPADGTLLEVFFEEGDDVPVLTNVCVIGETGEDISGFRPSGIKDITAETAVEAEKDAGMAAGMAGTEAKEGARPAEDAAAAPMARLKEGEPAAAAGISPRARNLAEKLGVDYGGTQGSGPRGRIIEKDIRRLSEEGRIITKAAYGQPGASSAVTGSGLGGRITTADAERAAQMKDSLAAEATAAETTRQAAADTVQQAARAEAAQQTAVAEYEDIKLTNIRKVIARTMHQSLSTMAQLTMNTSFDATAILELRKKIKALGKDMGLSNITLNDMSLYAVSRVLPDFRELNANFTEETLRVFKNVNLGVAVDTDRGLMVPTIFNANRKSLNEISAEARNLAEQCRNRTIKPDDLTGGTFTVTNLGALGIESFTPIINPPQTGILGVSGIVQRIKDTGEGIRSYPAMGLSLTIDHRVVDGAPAARFLNALARSLENFDLFLAL